MHVRPARNAPSAAAEGNQAQTAHKPRVYPTGGSRDCNGLGAIGMHAMVIWAILLHMRRGAVAQVPPGPERHLGYARSRVLHIAAFEIATRY